MRVGINITPLLQDQWTGVHLVIKNLIEELVEVYPDVFFVLIGLAPRASRHKLDSWTILSETNVELKIFSVPARWFHGLARAWQNMGIGSVELMVGKIDIFHQFDWFCFPSRAPQTATIFDCTPLVFPKWHTSWNIEVYLQRMKRVVDWSKHVFVISKSTGADVDKFYSQLSDKNDLVYPDVSSMFKLMDKDEVDQILETYHLKSGYFLFVGTVEPRKNLERVLEAFVNLRENNEDISLVIIGNKGWKHSPRLDQLLKQKGVVNLNYVEESQLPYFYAGSLALVYPSLYEGFGLPVLEALRSQTLVITSNSSSLPEVGGPGSIYCIPSSTTSITEAMKKVLFMKPSKRKQLIQMGVKQAKLFSYSISAEKMMNRWRHILAK